MSQLAKQISTITIEDELKQSYLDYAMSVIVGRALPDVRDGLKPVHRRALFAMGELGNDWNKPYKKSARIVGDVIGKYHPHGESAVYDTIVRMAQPFTLRYMLVDGQGNFGSVDGDSPAAMRYTEIRLTRLAHSLMLDLDKETVDFQPNYDETEMAPVVFPTRIPNLLVNGSSGIAVGMATNVPPHNLTEVISATIALIDNPALELKEMMEHVPGPDFPTAGIILGRKGIIEAYKRGRGRLTLRAKTDIETHEKTGRAAIIVEELPYQVNKARLLEKMAELVRDKRLEGISALRDESDKQGMRMVIEVRRGDQPEVVLNNLFKQTQLQISFGFNMVALDKGQPRLFNLPMILEAFLAHRREVVTRRSIYELNKARQRAHILEGLAIALANIDPVIALIKAAKNPAEAKQALLAKAWGMGQLTELLERVDVTATRPRDLGQEFGQQADGYHLSNAQAQAILELRLHRLTGLEQDKIFAEYRELIDKIAELLAILADPDKLNQVIREELVAIKNQFGDERRTLIVDEEGDFEDEDLIAEQEMVVTLSHEGYFKAQSLDSYSAQGRGGRGKTATKVKEKDFVKSVAVVNSHDTILCFSTTGKVYWLKGYQIPLAGRTARGRPVINLLPLAQDEQISAILPVKEFDQDHFVFLATKQGTVKKMPLSEFSKPRPSGLIALGLTERDRLIGARITNGSRELILISDAGKAIRFDEGQVRPMGRTARGVRGIKLQRDQAVIALMLVEKDGAILTGTERGYGQRTSFDLYRTMGRGNQGVQVIKTSERNGKVVSAVRVHDEDEVLLISNGGTLVRIRACDISSVGRNTQGVRLMRLADDESLVGIGAVRADVDDEDLALESKSGLKPESDV